MQGVRDDMESKGPAARSQQLPVEAKCVPVSSDCMAATAVSGVSQTTSIYEHSLDLEADR